eukprot:6557187-Prymnesium_polylepis.1
MKWYNQREKIQYALAQDNKTHRMPSLDFCKIMWDKIDDSIIKSLGPGATQADLYTRCGFWAAKSMNRASMAMSQFSEGEEEEEEEEEERNQRPQQPAGRRRQHHLIGEDSDDEHRPRQRPRRAAQRRAVVESDDHDDEEPAPSAASSSAA